MKRLLVVICALATSLGTASVTTADPCLDACYETYYDCAMNECGGNKCPDCVDLYSHCLDTYC